MQHAHCTQQKARLVSQIVILSFACAYVCRCDREDRHRGLCNHRATIPGPAACTVLVRPKQQMQDDEQDTSSMDQGKHTSLLAARRSVRHR